MNIRQKLIQNKIGILVAAVLILFAGMLYWFMKSAPTQVEDTPRSDDLVEFQGSEIEEKDGDRLIWRLSSEKIQVDPKTQKMYFTSPKAEIWEKDGTELTVTAKLGIVDRAKKTIELKQPIEASTDKGDTLQTEGSVYYNMDTRLIKGGKVLLTRHDKTAVSGDSFETNASLDQVTVQGHAKITKGE